MIVSLKSPPLLDLFETRVSSLSTDYSPSLSTERGITLSLLVLPSFMTLAFSVYFESSETLVLIDLFIAFSAVRELTFRKLVGEP